MNADQLKSIQAPLKQKIRLRFTLDTDAPEDERATLIRLTERYCVVPQTLRQAPPIAVV